MNEHQHQASVALANAQARQAIIRDHLTAVVAEVAQAERALREAVVRDPRSWNGTPDAPVRRSMCGALTGDIGQPHKRPYCRSCHSVLDAV